MSTVAFSSNAMNARNFTALGKRGRQGYFAPLGSDQQGVPDTEIVALNSEIRAGAVVNYASAGRVERDELRMIKPTVAGSGAMPPQGIRMLPQEIALKGDE
jgi:hypothetical protein